VVYLRIAIAIVFVCLSTTLGAQTDVQIAFLPDAPSALLTASAQNVEQDSRSSSSIVVADASGTSRFSLTLDGLEQVQIPAMDQHGEPMPQSGASLDSQGKPIPLNRQQPHRILGFMPNFRTVSAGAVVHPPGWKYNFTVATHQALDYSTFVFLGLTSLTAEGLNSHPSLGKGVDGFYAYTWRGFLDKTDGTYLSAWLLPSLLHEDTRYYPLGAGHPIVERALYVISRQAISRTYSGHDTPAFATLGGKALTQYISRFYYPTSSEGFGVLATKFGYSVMRDVAFSSIREFYPDIAAHYITKHRARVAAVSARDAQAAGVTPKP
jgi:hypothetical protein